MKSITEAELGAYAREIISGFEGVIVGKTLHLNGCHRVIIQPTKLKDGEPLSALSVDVQQVDIVPDIPVIKSGNIGLEWGNAKLGTRARDLITDYQGIVVSKTEWFGGKKRVGIQSKDLHDGKAIPIHDFDVTCVEVLDPKQLFGDVEANVQAGPGGPFPEPKP
jgi:hypothetical protein